MQGGTQRTVDKELTSSFLQEKNLTRVVARIISVHGRIILLRSFLATHHSQKSISLRDERNLVPLHSDSVERGARKNEERKTRSTVAKAAGKL
jgi:hypothetical protein